jgi:hypothetical protein
VRGQEVGERGKRELRFGVGRPRLKDCEPPLAREPRGLAPDRRLADAGLALEDERARRRRLGSDERTRGRELLLAADELDP